jgi:Methyl-accepting chemotaxis protein
MSWFYNLKIVTKLLVGFILVAIIAGVLGVVGVINIKTSDKKYADLYEYYGVAQGDIGQVAINFQLIRLEMREAILAESGSDKSIYESEKKEYDKKVNNYLAAFEKSIQSDQVQSEFNKLKDALDKFNPTRDKIIQLAENDKDSEALALMKEAKPLANSVQDAINNMIELKTTQGRQTSDDLSKYSNNTILVMIIIIVIAIIIAFILGIFISQVISKPVKQLVSVADKLAVGDINVNVDAKTKDEIGNLMDSFSRMIANIREQAYVAEKIASGDLTVDVKIKSENDVLGKNLREMVEQNNDILSNINSASEQVATGAKQVSASSQALSQGSTEQASSIEEITASIEEIASQTRQNAVNANQANELAFNAKDKAVQGNSQMAEMLRAMGEINDSSNNISKIIKVIDEIAFQTNILSLNAAVEAARAGQHGKGFAVVAEEVRNLAARSANAAKETTAMIEGSIKKVEIGTRIANETATALNQIVDGVAKAANLVGEIATASNEQASGIAQVNQAISQVAQVVQTNSATSEESASASEELSSQAELLKDLVSKYKLKKNLSYKNYAPALSPEVLKMLDDMANKRNPLKEAYSEAAASKLKISLDDKDFGKY